MNSNKANDTILCAGTFFLGGKGHSLVLPHAILTAVLCKTEMLGVTSLSEKKINKFEEKKAEELGKFCDREHMCNPLSGHSLTT